VLSQGQVLVIFFVGSDGSLIVLRRAAAGLKSALVGEVETLVYDQSTIQPVLWGSLLP
jgi:hypothetical protein